MKQKYLDINSMEYLRYLFSRKIMEFSIQDSITVSLDRAMRKSAMINLQQQEGNGKSTGLASYIIGRPFCYYMKIGPSYGMRNVLSEMVFLMTGQPPGSYTSNWDMVKEISRFLTVTKEKRLVCIDDCTHLSFRQLSFFQEIRDATISTTALVFIAPPAFKKRLEKAREKGVAGVGEFYRRFQSWVPLPGLTPGDISKYCTKRKLTPAETKIIVDAKLKTIAELEIDVDKIIEAREYEND